MSTLAEPRRRIPAAPELAKVRAFLVRDVQLAVSYRTAFVTDMAGLFGQALLFAFVGRMVDPSLIPQYGGSTGYLDFVVIGITLTGLLRMGIGRLQGTISTERFIGTLESVIMTPTSMVTLQLGWLAYDLVYVPIRTAAFLVVMTLAFGLSLEAAGALPATLFVVAFLPIVWGVGAAAAAATLLFRRGTALTSAVTFGLTFTSGAYFPLDLFPEWIGRVAAHHPVALVVEGARRALLGEADELGAIAVPLLELVAWSAVILPLGLWAFRRAFERELDTGNIGLY